MNRISIHHPRSSANLLSLAAIVALGGAAFAGYAAGRASSTHELYAAQGGLTIYTDGRRTQGVQLSPGAGGWSSVSDRSKKENFRGEDPDQVLERVSRLPVASWNYRTQSPSVRHVGPTAQDFYSSFRLGESDTTITATDMAGVSLLAIQALYRRTTALERQQRTAQGIAVEAPARGDARRRP